ncbi:hypothetical protein JTE90_029694 [Oedothorax gibbosus]|uniref:SSD domain-containing protein n=1 Tax=Oedothorax gibbosus TaxID=931172 RepID=A0AAV6UKZ2_9ARAC|nr:hypothetical protein JTE90_029694 [Oedothorax gibbosus]
MHGPLFPQEHIVSSGAMCSFMFYIIYIFTLYSSSNAVTSESNHCVMMGSCKGRHGPPPCVFSKPAQPLEDYFVPERNMSVSDLLKKMCPEFAIGKTPHVCCDAIQLINLAEKFDLMEAIGFARCPSCVHNLRRFSCVISCAPYQNRFLNVTESQVYEGDHVVKVLTCHLSELFAYRMFDSCKGVNGFIPGTHVMDFTCGSYGASKCSAKRWLEYIGAAPEDGGPSPMKTDYVLQVQDTVTLEGKTYYPMKASSFKCSESPGPGLEKCLCYDCKESCSAQSLVPPVFQEPSQPFTIFNLDGPMVVATLVLVSFVIITTLVSCLHKELWGKTLNGTLNRKVMNTTVTLGSLEEVSPLRSKVDFTSRIFDQACEQKLHGDQQNTKSSREPLRCVWLGNWLVDALEGAFSSWSLFVSGRPWTVMSVSLTACAALSTGLLVNFDVTTNPVDLWVSHTSEGRRDLDHFNEHFEPFYRIEHIILVPTNNNSFYHPIVFNHELRNISWGPVFQQDFLLAALDLQLQIENLTSSFNGTTVTLEDICEAPLKPLKSECVVQSVFGFFQNRVDLLQNKTRYLTHFKGCSLVPQDPKCFAPFGGPLHSSAVVLGGFGSSYDSSEALVITIPVKNYNDDHKNAKANAWEAEFTRFLENYSNPLMKIAFKAERSIKDEVIRISESDSLTIAMSYVIMLCYITVALGEFRDFKNLLVESKLTLGLFGVLIVLLSVASSLGLFCWLRVPATLIIVEVIPFLVLAVGVDNIFILVQTFQRNKNENPELTLEQRISAVVGKVAPSMLLSSISMSCCFFIGTLTEMPAVKIFALYAGVALLVNFFLQMTCFLVLFNLDSKRQEKGRLDAFCCIKISNITSDKPKKNKGLMYGAIKNIFAPFLMNNNVRYLVMISYIAWLCSSAAVLDKISIDLNPKLAVPEDSHIRRYFDYIEEYLSVGPPVYFVISDGYNYTTLAAKAKICSAHSFCSPDSISSELGRMAMAKNKTYIAFQPISWMDNFYEYLQAESCCYEFRANGTHCTSYVAHQNKGLCRSCRERNPSTLSEVEFVKKLKYFLDDAPWEKCPKGGKAMFGTAIEMHPQVNSYKIGSTHFMTYHTVLKTSEDFYESLRWSRKIAQNLTESLRNGTGNPNAHVFPYSLPHAYYEQYLTMWPDTLRSLGLSVASVAVATYLFLGLDLHSAAIVTFSVASIVLNVMGLMYWWDISLNAISLVNLVVAVGISVEFCSHLTRSFALSDKCSRSLRAQDALCEMGTSIISGITLTDCGILVLAFAKSQIFKVFYFRMYVGIIAFGTLHGIIILPVLLSLFGPPKRCKETTSIHIAQNNALMLAGITKIQEEPTNEDKNDILLTRI